ncbi:RNA-guided endonuclease InsQ/TnpB family protein [Actinoallomurus sp. CA-150999]|uniref:RNA-guided endonuclease InsQ/TnpB family protein n=1 Tax=Actinoallomurus sp. CA-150999 TaxID=3239887 RepID=UPI003D8BFC6F
MLRTARVSLRLTPAQRRRGFGLLASAGDVWACVLDMNRWRRQRGLYGIVDFQQLCRELHQAGSGTFGELNAQCAEGVLRRYSDAWFAAAKRRKNGDATARFPRRKRGLVPVRFRYGNFVIEGQRLRLSVARGYPPLWLRLDREVPYPADQVRSITLLNDGRRLFVDVTAEVPVATYEPGCEPAPDRVAGVDPGVIHPFAVAGPDGEGLVVSGRAIRAETHVHLKDTKYRRRKMAPRAPKPGQAGSRRWRKFRARQRKLEARHKRRVKQAQHEAAKTVVTWAAQRRIGTLMVGDPRGVLEVKAGRRHNRRVREWRVGYLLRCLKDKAEQAGIRVVLVDERGTSSTCPACDRRVPKPTGRVFTCMHCGFSGHRDLVGGANIARRGPGGPITTNTNEFPVVITHRRAGRHLPGTGPARRDPRRRPHHGTVDGAIGRPRPAPPPGGESLALRARINNMVNSPPMFVDAALSVEQP